MKIFQTVQKKLAALGLVPNQQRTNNWQMSSGQIASVVICSVDVIKLCVYIFCEASSIEEYMDLIFSLTFVVGTTITYTSIILKNDKVFITIELCAKELNDSELMPAIQFLFGGQNMKTNCFLQDRFGIQQHWPCMKESFVLSKH